MCGIFGFVNRTPYTSVLMPFLALEMLRRGKDSWGVTDGVNTIKKLGPIIDSWHLPAWGKSLIFHTRAGSVGDKVITNQHPFAFPEIDAEDQPTRKIIVGVHNGGISNHSELNTKYKRNFSVDSMHVFAHIAEGWPLSELRGYGAFVWFEVLPGEEPEMHFARCNMYDFHIFRINQKSLVFCSLRTPVVDTAKLFGWDCEELSTIPDYEYTVVTNTDGVPTIVQGEAFNVSARESYQTRPGVAVVYNHDRPSWSAGICPKCHYGIAYCHCDEDDTDTLEFGSDDAILQFWMDVARSGDDERIFAKELPASAKGTCRKCNQIDSIHKGTELVCPSCLLKLVKTFVNKELSYVYNW